MVPKKSAQIVLRVEPETLELADQVAIAIARSAVTGSAPPKAEIMRAALRKGLEQMLTDLKPAKRRK